MPNPLTPPPPTGIGILDRWLALLWRKLTAAGEILWAQVSKSGSNLTDIETRNHADLQNLNTASYTHLTATNHTDLTDGGDTLLHYHLRHDVTGILTGGVLSVSVGGTTFSITDGTGQVINNYTTPLTPTITPVSWSGKTNVTDTLLSEPANYILIDSAGAVVQQATAPTDDELRDKILIGVIAHANNLIIAFAPLMVSAYQNGNLAQDILSALGTITTGCTYARTAALTFRRASGSIFRRGAHYTLDAKTPNAVDLTAQDPAQFASYCRNGSNTVFSNSAVGTTLTANRYDDGTAAAAGIPNGVVNNNQWQAMRLFLSTNGFTLLQYGQQIYNSLDDVVAGVLSENWFQAPITRLTSFRGFLFVRGGASNLSSVSDAYFQPAGKLGDFAAASASPVFDHDHNAAGSGGVLTNDEHDGYSEYATSSTPATPASGKMAIFAEDAGGGVARLRAVHSTGSNLAFFRDSVIRVRNQSGSTILKAKAVYVTGATSGTPTVAPAKADAITTMPALGLLIADTANAAFGTVQFCGLISNIDTSAFSEGARLYVSATTAGDLTSTEPSHPNVSQVVGVVITANPTSGSVFIFPSADTVQGGQAGEHYTLTAAEHTGTGTGVMVRKTGGAIDPASIGAVTPGTGAFTTLSSSGSATLGDSTSSDSHIINGTTLISANSASTALEIRQVGSGNALFIEDSANPDSTPLMVDGTGKTVIGHTAGIATAVGVNPLFQVHGATQSLASIGFGAWSVSSGQPATFYMGRSPSGTIGTHAACPAGQDIGKFQFDASNGTSFLEAAFILAEVDATPSAGNTTGRIVFGTNANTSGNAVERAQINQYGVLRIGANAVTGPVPTPTVGAKFFSEATTYTDGVTSASGSVSHGVIHSFDNPALAASNTGVIYRNASTLYIDGAPTAGANVTISNPWALNVNSGAACLNGNSNVRISYVLSPSDITAASYDSKSKSIAAEEATPQMVQFSVDGKRMFVMGSAGDDINYYLLSTAWDVSTATFQSLISISGQDNAPAGGFFRLDGMKFYMVGQTNDAVFEYDLSTAWDISTLTYTTRSFSVLTEDGAATGVTFSPDGLNMYICGNSTDSVYRYTLGTAWDVSTASIHTSLSVAAQESAPQDLQFTRGGSVLLVIGSSGDDINQYNLSVPWDISTAVFHNVFSVSSQDDAPAGLYLRNDGRKFYMIGQTSDTVYQYSLPEKVFDFLGRGVFNDLDSYGYIKSSSETSGIGYSTGAGGTVTQLTSKATGVTLNKVCGQITTAADALAANTRTSFTLTNSAIAATDLIHVHRVSGGTANSYRIEIDSVASGSCVIAITNITAGSLSESVVIGFNVFKGVTS